MIPRMLRAAIIRAIGTARKFMPTKDITIEQEEMLARIAMAPRMLKKHWKWLENSGLTIRRQKWRITPRARFYIEMITQVHGPGMASPWTRSWSLLLRWTSDTGLIESFWSHHESNRPRY